jgi:hypothetical protein
VHPQEADLGASGVLHHEQARAAQASIVGSTAHEPVRPSIAAVTSSMVSSASASASPIAAMTSSACSGVKRTSSGCIATEDGSAENAAVHISRSSVGSRCTVPRGTEGLDQGAISPDGVLHICAGSPREPPSDRMLGGVEDLCVCSAHHSCDVGRAEAYNRFGQPMAGQPPGRDADLGQRRLGRGLRHYGHILPGPTASVIIVGTHGPDVIGALAGDDQVSGGNGDGRAGLTVR